MSSRRRRARRNLYLIGAAVAASILLLLLAVGAYPLAVVNGRVIWAATYRSYVASALAYQQAARDTYSSATSTPLLDAATSGEVSLGMVALDDLVEQRIIESGLEVLVGENAPRLIDNKVRDLQNEPMLPGASRALFQLDPEAFRTAILRPQAMREVLDGRVYLDGKTYEEWVAQARKEARVRLLSSTYRWDGEQVRAK
jgi:hypothetical protein